MPVSPNCEYQACAVLQGNTLSGFRADGATAADEAGWQVAVGDVNGDGIPDLIIGAYHTAYSFAGAGSVYVVFGTKSGFPDPLPLSTLNGGNGFRLDGASANENAGSAVSVGDFNGDGINDIIIGSPNAGNNGLASSGSIYVVYGGATMKNGTAWSTCPCTLNSGGSIINATNGIRFDGEDTGDYAGSNLAMGDFNGDGITDLISGSGAYINLGWTGVVYVVYGGPTMKNGTAWLTTNMLTNSALATKTINGTNGIRFTGATAGYRFGNSLAVGDVNGDGYADIITSADHASYNVAGSGSIYVIYGGSTMKDGTAWAKTQPVTAGAKPINGTDGFRLDGEQAEASQGLYTVTVGDINGDGYADFLISNFSSSLGGPAASGSVYAVLGSANLMPSTTVSTTNASKTATPASMTGLAVGQTVNSNNIPAGTTITALNSPAAGNIQLSNKATATAAGTAMTVATSELTTGGALINGTNGFRLDGASANDKIGGGSAFVNQSIMAIGDINRDGFGDIIIGAQNASYNGAQSGSAYVIYGNAVGGVVAKLDGTAWAASNSLNTSSAVINGTNGFRLDGNAASESTGNSIAVGDANGNGYPDIIVSAYSASPHGAQSGSVYMVDGQSCTYAATNSLSTVVSGPVVCSPNAAVESTYLAVGHQTSPYINIYKRTGDTFTNLPAPVTLPASYASGQGISFSPNGAYLAVAHANSPYVSIYTQSGDTFTKLPDPATLPPSLGNAVAFSHDNTYLAVGHNSSPYVTIYRRSGNTFTKIADPATLPTGNGYGVSFSKDDNYLAVATQTSPYVTIYKINESTDTFTKIADPATLPAGNGMAVSFSNDNNYLAVGHQNPPKVTIYRIKESTDTFTKIADPATLPTGIAYGVAFSLDNNYLAVAHGGIPYVTIYEITESTDTFTKLADPATLPAGTGQGVAFSTNGTYLSVAHQNSPYITIYKQSAGTFTKLPDPTTLPLGLGWGVGFSPQ